MSTPKEFMERVVAWPGPNDPGFVNLHWKTPRGTWGGRPFKDIDKFMDMAQWGATKPSIMTDIYFCLSTQSKTGKTFNGKDTAARHGDSALLLKAIWLDVDVKPEKGYASLNAALDAITAFVQAAHLPPPSAVVFSGGGLHIYWINENPLNRSEWQAYADGLRAEGQRLGLKFDEGVTTDAARVLRVPGTFNHKTTPPKVCRLAGLGQSYNFGVDLGRLAFIVPRQTVITAAVTRPAVAFDLRNFLGKKPASAFSLLDVENDRLSEGINVFDDRPLNPDGALIGCPHLYEAACTGGVGYIQGLWMLDVLACTFLEDGERWARKMSDKHKTYDKDEFKAMWDRKVHERADKGLGWPSCTAFENEGSKPCLSCVYRGKIKSPLSLAERSMPAVAQPPPLPLPPAELHLPADKGYMVNEAGIIGITVEKKATNGTSIPEFIPIFMCRVHTPWTEGGIASSLHFTAEVAKDTSLPVTITDADMASEQTLVASLCKQRCKPEKRGERFLVDFMRSWTALRDEEIKRQDTAPYGWVFEAGERAGFAYGGKVFEDTGNIRNAGHADPTINRAYMPVGKADPFYALLDMISSENIPLLEILVLGSFAAPLMFFSGETNGVLWAFSREAGAHKSTSIATGAGVWGDPEQSREKSTTSMVSLEGKMGTLRNLPIILDELTDQKMVEEVADQVGNFTESGMGGKMRRDRSQQEKKNWQTMMVCGSNASLREVTLKTTKDTDAKILRIFEIEAFRRQGMHDGAVIRKLVASLSHNHGQVGILYAQHLGTHHKQIEVAGTQILKDFKELVHFKDEERFWAAMCAAIIEAANIANAILPKKYFHVVQIYKFLLEQYELQRNWLGQNLNVGGTQMNALDALGQFFKAVSDHHLFTDKLDLGKGGRPSLVTAVKMPTRAPVHVRWAQNSRAVQISKKAFQDYCEKVLNQQFSAVWKGLEKNFAATQHRINLAAGVRAITQLPEAAIIITVPAGSPFEDMLFTGKPLPENSAPMTNGSELDQHFAAAKMQAQADLELVIRSDQSNSPHEP